MKVIDFLSAGLPLNATPKASEDLTLHALSEYPLLVIISTYMNDIDFSELTSYVVKSAYNAFGKF